jgi:hypothetical protein
MGADDITSLVVRPVIMGGMRARKTRSNQGYVTKKQVAGFVLAAAATAIFSRVLNDLVERHLAA